MYTIKCLSSSKVSGAATRNEKFVCFHFHHFRYFFASIEIGWLAAVRCWCVKCEWDWNWIFPFFLLACSFLLSTKNTKFLLMMGKMLMVLVSFSLYILPWTFFRIDFFFVEWIELNSWAYCSFLSRYWIFIARFHYLFPSAIDWIPFIFFVHNFSVACAHVVAVLGLEKSITRVLSCEFSFFCSKV